MHLCYIDESGTPDIPGNTSHFVLAGLSVPVWRWRECDKEIELIKRKYALELPEIHVAWILRPYLEQSRIPNFATLDYTRRRAQVEGIRTAELLRLQRSNLRQYRQTRKNYRNTEGYIHHLSEVRAFADHLHAAAKHWKGEMFGWQAEYTPESRKKPADSKMQFTPADFWIGESGIWFYSLMWERGKSKEPVEFLDDRGIIKSNGEADRAPAPLRRRG